VISLAPGIYLNDFPDPIIRPMSIQSSSRTKRAVLQATVALPNQKGILLTFSSLTVRGLEMTDAFIDDSLGGNGAAIRDQNPENISATLVVQNSLFHDNQTAILQGNDIQETVTIINSQFKNNGNPASLSSSTRCDIAANGGCSYHLGLLRCAVVLADGAPLALAEIRSPLSPGHGALAGLE